MIGERTDFTITATVLTPLHIGTGENADVADLGKDGDVAKVALVHVDFQGFPTIPGSGIKGALAQRLGQDVTLFGGESGDPANEMLVSGQVIFWSGVMDRTSCQTFGPHNEKIVPRTNYTHAQKSLFIEVSTAIDAESGVALAGRLYHKQMVSPGTRFELGFSADTGVDEALMASLFAVLCDGAGVYFGKATKSSLGRVTVDLKTLKACALGTDGAFVDKSAHWQALISTIVPDAEMSLGKLHLSCSGPFLITDPSVVRKRGDNSTPQIAARHTHLDQPLLAGTSLLGALRAEFADWLAKSDRCGTDNKDTVCKTANDAKKLSPTERIFGVTGWKGLIGIRDITSTGANRRQTIASVKLDRFSNAPIDNALFKTEVWVSPSFTVTLEFDPCRGNEKDREYLEEYLKALCCPTWGGLQLGHGASKGIGWFTVDFERSVA